MASPAPGASTDMFRHRITSIMLEPSTATRDISLKILVDGLEAHRLPAIQQGAALSWNHVPYCDVNSSSSVEIRVYEKHFLRTTRVGTLAYAVSDVGELTEATLDFDPPRFKAMLSFPTPEAESPAAALAKAQAMGQKTRPLERLGPTRAVLKAILDGGEIISELNPVAKIVVSFCKIAWQTLEKQEECDASVEKLVVDLVRMLPFVDRIEKAAKLPQLQSTLRAMRDLIEDALEFIIKYKSDTGPVQGLRAVVGSEAQDQVQDLLEKFKDLKEYFDRGVDVRTFETVDVVDGKVDTVQKTVDAVREALITDAQRESLDKLKPVGSARYNPSRVCLPGTRSAIIEEIVYWSQQQDVSEGLLWVHGQAGLGKSSIAASVCQELDGRKLLAAEFFCKRDSSDRRDPQQVMMTIVYGLALQHPGYAKSVAEAIQGDPRLCSSSIQIQFDNLVKTPLETASQPPLLGNMVVIVDALDECGTAESRRQLPAYLHRMHQLAPWLKVIVSSRPDPDIQLFFDDRTTSGVQTINVYDYDASNDIHSFVDHCILNSPKSTHLPPDVTDLLTERAAGLFIWAKTACELILSGHNPKLRFDLVMGKTGSSQTSSPLDALYTTAIETSLGDGGADDATYVKDCLVAIIVCSTRTPLSVASLSDLIDGQIEQGVLQSVVDSLGSVLYTDHAQGDAVRVYHHSFTDYMTSSAPSEFRVDTEQLNTAFAGCCLRTMVDGLRFNICGLETSHLLNSQVPDLTTRVDIAISPPLRYSCQYWTSHLAQSRRGELEDLLRDFLLQPTLLYWIEVLSLLGKLDVALFSALELSGWYQGPDDIHLYAKDTHRFILAFYDPISKSTPHLYVSALAFCPTHAPFIQRLRATFQNTLVVIQGAKTEWSPWLRCISHPAKVNAIAVSKDGRFIVSGSYDRTVRVWDADTGRALGDPLIGHSNSVFSVGFSPDGRLIVSGSNDFTVRVWNADTSEAFGDPLVGHSNCVTSVEFSPDGRHIVSGSNDETVRLWDVYTGQAIGNPLVGHSGYVTSVGFSPDGRRIVSGSWDETVRVWEVDTGKTLGNPLVGHGHFITSVGFSPDGCRVVSGSWDKTVRVWDVDTGEAIGEPLIGHQERVHSVGFSPNGRHIVSGSYDKTVRVWDVDTGEAFGVPLEGHTDWVNSVQFSPDGHRIVSGSEDCTVRVWDTDICQTFGDPLVGHSRHVNSVGFSPDGHRIVSGSDDCTVRMWNADTGEALGDPLVGHSGHVNSVGFSPDGRHIVSGSNDCTIQVWDVDTGEASGNPLVGHSGHVTSVGFSPDGRRIVSGSNDETVRVWDADTGQAFGDPLVGHSSFVTSVGFSPDGRLLVSGSIDSTVRVWDANTGDAFGDPLVGHSNPVYSVGFSPDSRRIVSGSRDCTVRVWDVNTGEPLGDPLEGHYVIYSVGFSPDGRFIVAGSEYKSMRMWDADTGQALSNFLVGHSIAVLSFCFSPDSRRIVSGSRDDTMRIWDLAPEYATSLPHNTSQMYESLSDGGWVREAITESILIWLPEEYRRSEIDNSTIVISQSPVAKPVVIDSSRFVHGPDWALIYTP